MAVQIGGVGVGGAGRAVGGARVEGANVSPTIHMILKLLPFKPLGLLMYISPPLLLLTVVLSPPIRNRYS